MDGSKVVAKKETLSVKELAWRYVKSYCDRSTIHGVRYLFDENLYSIERFCWSGIVVTSLIVTLACYLILAQRYSEQVLITVVETSQYPVFNVEFPAVAVCPQRRVRWHKFEQAKATFLPADASNDTQAVFRDFVERMEFVRFGSFSTFSKMDDLNLEKIDFVNITRLAMFLSFTCEEIFPGNCYWRKHKYPCCEIFVWEKTETGGCLVFNSAIGGLSQQKMKEDPLYPWRNAKSGEESGLVFKVDIKSPDEEIFLMIKKSEQWTDVMYSLKANTDTVVVVSPQYTITDANARGVPPEKRGCIYDTETSHPLFKNIEGLKYQQRNCLNVCHEEHLLRYCNCTIPMFFPWNDTHRECRPSDYRCIYKFRDVFSFDKRLFEDKYVRNIQGGGMLCPCLISCDALQYFVTITTLPIANQKRNATSIITVDVHYQSEVGLKYRTSREFTYLEMIASFGGLVGLFLGASIISAIELFYHLTFGLILYLKSNHFFDFIWKHLRKLWRPPRPQPEPTTACASSTPPKRLAWHKAANRRRY